MKLIDRMFLMAVFFFALHFAFCRIMPAVFAAAASAVCAAAFYHGVMRICAVLIRKRERRRNDVKAVDAFLSTLPFIQPEKAQAKLLRFVREECKVRLVNKNGALCLWGRETFWIGFCLRHPESGPVSVSEIAQVLIEAENRKADHAYLACLCDSAVRTKDPSLSGVRLLFRKDIIALCLRHKELIPLDVQDTEQAKKTAWSRMRSLVMPAIGRDMAVKHVCYAGLLLPGFLLSKSPVLLLCIGFHLFFGACGLLKGKSKASARLFG